MVFAGYRLFYLYLLSSGFLAAGGATLVLMSAFTDASSVAVLVLTLVVGGVAGVFTLLVHWAGISLGAVLAALLITAVINLFLHHNFIIWIILVVSMIAAGVMSLFGPIQRWSVIACSAFLGAYGFVAAIDYLAKSQAEIAYLVPRLFYMMDSTREWPNWLSWMLIGFVVVLAIVGAVVQIFISRHYEHKPLFNLFGKGSSVGYEEDEYESEEEFDRKTRVQQTARKYGGKIREMVQGAKKKSKKSKRLFDI
eukprot:TRINITY_DN505_c0_g2_i2.p1 TRINITY_DN505_c0_g2~~TRINITY_DN505_c0_g2_i2.p1  ORF type:complete len:252 (-),score=64.10 TRINITY_DN505_c0_g2_i2:159-914(-)